MHTYLLLSSGYPQSFRIAYWSSHLLKWLPQYFHFDHTLGNSVYAEAFPQIGDHEVTILMHNDAVVQGLSEVPFMRHVKRWGALTIGTGLGNARFTNRQNGKG